MGTKIENRVYYTTSEAGKLLHVSAQTVKRYCNVNPPRLKGRKIGHAWMVPATEVTRYRKESAGFGRPKKIQSI